MNIELERRQIIEELNHVNDEWLLKAIKRLLGLDYEDDISEEHKNILDSRIDAYESGSAKTVEWDEAVKRLNNEQTPNKTMAGFWNILSDETAEDLHKQTLKNRKGVNKLHLNSIT